MPRRRLKIKPIVANSLGDRSGNQMIDRLTRLDSRANLRRRKPQWKPTQPSSAKGGRENGFLLAGPRDNHKFGQTRQFAGLAPLRQFSHVIAADQIEKLRAGELPGIVSQSIDRVRSSTALDFLFINLAPGLACQRQPKQAKSFRRRRGFAIRFERRLCRRNEKQPCQTQLLARGLRYEQMTKMDGIERTAE